MTTVLGCQTCGYINLAKSPFVACDQKTAVMTQYQKTYQNIIGEGGCCEVEGVKTNNGWC